jgi:hypothetical protein
MDAKSIENGLYVIGVDGKADEPNDRYYQVLVADNFVEIRDFTTHAKLLDLSNDTADDIRRILNRVFRLDDNRGVYIDEVMERCSWICTRSPRSSTGRGAR